MQIQRHPEPQWVRVLNLFEAHPGLKLSPSKVHAICFDEDTPLTSTRRAITELTNRGWLRKTQRYTRGAYGRAERCWQYSKEVA